MGNKKINQKILTVESPHDHLTQFMREYNSRRELLVLYHASWCGHCVTLMPIFNKFKKEIKKKYTSDLLVYTIENDAIKQLVRTHNFPEPNISGFPTLMFYSKERQTNTFTGDRSVTGLLDFYKQNATLQPRPPSNRRKRKSKNTYNNRPNSKRKRKSKNRPKSTYNNRPKSRPKRKRKSKKLRLNNTLKNILRSRARI
jgi:thiol-disulfide isomerase/thioredoxin